MWGEGVTTTDLAVGDRQTTAGQLGNSDRTALITVDEVGFRYPNGVHTLNGFSMTVEPGRTVGLVGPSGCGKTTILKLLAGLLSPNTGQVVRSGDLRARPSVTMLFQQDTLLPWLSIRDNVALYARFLPRRQRKRAEVDAKVHQLLELVGLEDFAGALPHELSGGMRRRAAFLASVAPQPTVLLLDEPFSAVDEPTRIAIHEEVFKVTKLMRTAVVLVTHDLAEAITMSDSVLILSKRPSLVAHAQEIPFGESREMFKLRETDAYGEIYRDLWHRLRLEIGAAS